ncbi:hypothetical protein LBMAG42_09720 [Deltaproteobacteria bacterium]|nr:hypothetical protein LBMAG42_09720 [Deltaproteobacteria bacterium]
MNAWFAPAAPWRLAVLRWGVGGFYCWQLLGELEQWRKIGRFPRADFEGVGPASLFPSTVDPVAYDVWLYATIALAICFTIGVCSRITVPAFALSSLFLHAYRSSFQFLSHADNLAALHALVLAAAPCAAVWSVDAWAGGRWTWVMDRTAGPEPSERFGWPIRLMCAVTAATYFLAGFSKLSGPLGLAWASGENLRDQIGKDQLNRMLYAPDTLSVLTERIYQSHAWLGAAASVTLLLEIGAPLLLLSRWTGRIGSLGLFGMHWGIRTLMGIAFVYPLTGIAFWSFFLLPPREETPAP